ncbi:D-alanine--D-alanine ligase family protein [Fusibacter sp. JL216-2]|uniref:D-alanine--D-alanine ligase family protein n=1 Tax=Fusibacter sp. JL216-2 TaxID=3071453 RepID=UPI003D353C21
MIKIGVFFGSQSVEHEVSVITALQAMNHLKNLEDYSIVPVFIDKSGDWYTGQALMSIENFKDMPKLLDMCTKVNMVRQGKAVVLIPNPVKRLGPALIDRIDIAFPIIHGTFGEDGTIQGIFEMTGLPYVGCDVLAAAMTMDKTICKHVLMANNIPVIDGVWFTTDDWLREPENLTQSVADKLGYPVIVKPANMGSSVGVSVAHSVDEFYDAVHFCRHFTNRILVEKMVEDLMEINISVLGDCEGVEVSACERPLSSSEFLSFEDKYTSGGSAGGGSKGSKMSSGGSKASGMASLSRVLPADIPDSMREDIEDIAKKAFLAVDASGVTRLDFIIDKASDTIYLNELNTIPGSLAFYLWAESGKPYEELLEDLIELAYRKDRRKSKLQFSNETNILSTANIGGSKGSKK